MRFTSLLIMLVSPALLCASISFEQLKQHYDLWLSKEIHSYQYLIQKNCYCSTVYTKQFKVVVINGELVDVIDIETSKRVSDKVFTQQLTISHWYELSMSMSEADYGDIVIEIDESMLYPTSIYIDQHKLRADDEYTVFISDFEIL